MLRAVLLFLVATITASVCAADPIEVPLQFTRSADWSSTTCIASVRVADYDLLAPGARPAPVYIDFETSRSAGLTLVNDWSTSEVCAGRLGRAGRLFLFDIDDKYAFRGSRPELYVLVEYWDGSTSSELALWYDYRTATDSNAYREPVGPQFTGTNSWKQHQFHLTGVYAGGNLVYIPLPADFRLSPAPRQRFSRYSYGSAELTNVCPPGDWKLPDFESTRPLFAMVKLGDSDRLAAFDERTSGTAPRAYFDENGNGDLTDDAAAVREAGYHDRDDEGGTGRLWHMEFPAIETTVLVEGKKLPFIVEWDARLTPPKAADAQTSVAGRLLVRSTGFYQGDVTVDGQKYFLAVSDNSGNGRFDDFASSATITRSQYDAAEWRDRSDLLHVIKYGATGAKPDWATRIDGDLSRYVAFGERLFRVEMLPAKSLLRLTPVEHSAEFAAVEIVPGTRSLVLLGDTTSNTISCFYPAGQVRIPPGSYSVHAYTLDRTDAEGDKWSVAANGGPTSPQVRMTAGSSNQLKYGDPFTVELSPTLSTKTDPGAGRSVDLGLKLRGPAGETVDSIRHEKGTLTSHDLDPETRSRPRAPRYRIAKMDGELVTEGSLEYG
jgi:hypothetical protein